MDKRKLFNLWKNASGNTIDKRNSVCQEVFKMHNIVEKDTRDKIALMVKDTCNYFKKLYTKHKRNATRVFKSNQKYFDKPFKLPKEILGNISLSPNAQTQSQILSTIDTALPLNVASRGTQILNYLIIVGKYIA